MYAIIKTGGKQYRAEAGKLLMVEKLDKNLGDQFDLSDVLMIGGDKPMIGNPLVKGAKVTVVVTQQDRGPKILILKKKRRKGYRKMNGHRQPFTQLFVVSISADGQTVKAETKAHVIDPMKKLERQEAHEAKLQAMPR
jgi:large subunit ribosomal protein L21